MLYKSVKCVFIWSSIKVVNLLVCFSALLFLFYVFLCKLSLCEELAYKTAQQYYLDGIYNYVDRNYTTSAEQFEALSKKHPYSQFTHNSLIMEAFTNYVDKEYSKIHGIAEVFFKLLSNSYCRYRWGVYSRQIYYGKY